MASMWDFIVKVFRGENDHADQARDRLKVVLTQDRVKITPEALEEMKAELVKALSEYMEIQQDQLDLKITREGAQTSLIASIPVKGGRAEIIGKHRVPTAPADEFTTKEPQAKHLPPTKAVKTPAKPRKKTKAKKAIRKTTRKKTTTKAAAKTPKATAAAVTA